ncbi:hypothetical protein EB233_01095 [Mesorhizobium erdmanii]|uniref:Uncharacterized protein n=1 Tax=Mesorhizobium erdmanii TaxID=1777866 RepID=A0A6M7UAJ5_9HYPH|nr:hypothetical protein EB233_01095 [Mesorhizobium erdmanii]
MMSSWLVEGRISVIPKSCRLFGANHAAGNRARRKSCDGALMDESGARIKRCIGRVNPLIYVDMMM